MNRLVKENAMGTKRTTISKQALDQLDLLERLTYRDLWARTWCSEIEAAKHLGCCEDHRDCCAECSTPLELDEPVCSAILGAGAGGYEDRDRLVFLCRSCAAED